MRPGRSEPSVGGRTADHLFLLLRAVFARRGDALFEIADALVPVHRRGWGSLYAAFDKGRTDEDALHDLLRGGQQCCLESPTIVPI